MCCCCCCRGPAAAWCAKVAARSLWQRYQLLRCDANAHRPTWNVTQTATRMSSCCRWGRDLKVAGLVAVALGCRHSARPAECLQVSHLFDGAGFSHTATGHGILSDALPTASSTPNAVPSLPGMSQHLPAQASRGEPGVWRAHLICGAGSVFFLGWRGWWWDRGGPEVGERAALRAKLHPSPAPTAQQSTLLVHAQVSKCYPRTTAGFAPELMALLEEQHAVLEAALRRTMVQALILLRNRNQVGSGVGAGRGSSAVLHLWLAWWAGDLLLLARPSALDGCASWSTHPPPFDAHTHTHTRTQLDPGLLLPLLFRLFRVNDKSLRDLLFRHIVAGGVLESAGNRWLFDLFHSLHASALPADRRLLSINPPHQTSRRPTKRRAMRSSTAQCSPSFTACCRYGVVVVWALLVWMCGCSSKCHTEGWNPPPPPPKHPPTPPPPHPGQDDNEMAAKKSLAVLTELWRRNVWRDARTVNVIGESSGLAVRARHTHALGTVACPGALAQGGTANCWVEFFNQSTCPPSTKPHNLTKSS